MFVTIIPNCTKQNLTVERSNVESRNVDRNCRITSQTKKHFSFLEYALNFISYRKHFIYFREFNLVQMFTICIKNFTKTNTIDF